MNKKIIFLAAAYVAWFVAALNYNKKNPEQISDEVEMSKIKNWNSYQALFDNFVEIHKNLFFWVREKVLTPENKEFLKQKEQEMLSHIDPYFTKAKNLFEEYKNKWEEFADEWKSKIDEVYKEATWEIDKIREQAPQKIDELQTRLNMFLDWLKEKLKK